MVVRKRPADRVESAIVRAIDRLCSKPASARWDTATWTRQVKQAVALLGRKKGYWMGAAGCDSAHGGEWLYDVCWLQYNSEITLMAAPLVMEVEWDPYGSGEDFQKLVLARADHRVMLLVPKTAIEASGAVEELLSHVRLCRHSSLGDRYLFGCWSETLGKFDWSAYVTETGRLANQGMHPTAQKPGRRVKPHR